MASSEALSHAFLEAHPADAARVLERLSSVSAASLLKSTPTRLAAPVLSHMLPMSGARCIEHLEDADAAGLLRAVGAQNGAALLRQFETGRQGRLIALLPTPVALMYELLLGYPRGTVGACMDPRVPGLPADMNAGDALERIRRGEETASPAGFVIDHDQRLRGQLALVELLRASATTPLSRLVHPSPHRLPAQSLVAGLQDHPGWHEASALPVVERGDRLVGVLTHSAMRRALALAEQPRTRGPSDSTLAAIAGAYWFSVSALLQAVVSQIPVEQPGNDA